MTTRTRLAQFIVKLAFAFVLTIAATVGSGVVAEQLGNGQGAVVYACTASGGGGC